MEFNHKSVLLDECIENLLIDPKGIYVDGTLGGAGHSREICKKLSSEGIFIGIDRDEEALKVGENRLSEFRCKKFFIQRNYEEIVDILDELGIEAIDGALLDLGVSSYQLDNIERGFSYMQNAPLDMRMNQKDGFTAYDIVNKYSLEDLHRIISKYGEERWSKRIAEFIIDRRKNKHIESTGELVEIIKSAIPKSARIDGPHPAKRTFQAIRIEVNKELELLESAIENFCKVLKPNGRLCVISFHSLEDRIVKDVINDKVKSCSCPKEIPICVCDRVAIMKKISRKPILPSKEELEENPRARSAKLRVAQKL